jgi:hypothetical protein
VRFLEADFATNIAAAHFVLHSDFGDILHRVESQPLQDASEWLDE